MKRTILWTYSGKLNGVIYLVGRYAEKAYVLIIELVQQAHDVLLKFELSTDANGEMKNIDDFELIIAPVITSPTVFIEDATQWAESRIFSPMRMLADSIHWLHRPKSR